MHWFWYYPRYLIRRTAQLSSSLLIYIWRRIRRLSLVIFLVSHLVGALQDSPLLFRSSHCVFRSTLIVIIYAMMIANSFPRGHQYRQKTLVFLHHLFLFSFAWVLILFSLLHDPLSSYHSNCILFPEKINMYDTKGSLYSLTYWSVLGFWSARILFF